MWDRAAETIKIEIAAQAKNPKIERWIASNELISHLRTGLKNCSFETRIKIIYGFE